MKKKTLAIVSSCAAIAMSASIIAGSTYALFTGEDTVNISVTAGQAKVAATVLDGTLETYSFNEKQKNGTWANGGKAGFNEDKEFILEYIAPGDSAEFDIQVTNSSTINIQYKVNYEITGALAKALKVEPSVAGGKWTAWNTTDAKEQTIHMTVSFPDNEDNNDYQDKKATVSFAVMAVQANATVYDDGVTAVIGDKNYETLDEAVAAAQDGDSVKLVSDFAAEQVQTLSIDKDITIVGNGTAKIANTHVEITDNANVSFEKVNFEENSYVNVTNASALSMTGCKATVNPSIVGNNSRSAFIAASSETAHGLKLNLIGNTFDVANASADPYSTAIFVWAYVGDSVISENIFGTEENPCRFVALETLNAAQGATIQLKNNTVYGTSEYNEFYAFDFYQNNSRDNQYTVLSSNNVINVTVGAKAVYAFCIEANEGKNALIFEDNGTVVNDNPITFDDIDLESDAYSSVTINGVTRKA